VPQLTKIFLLFAALTVGASATTAAPCPLTGGSVEIRVERPVGASSARVVLSGELLDASCDSAGLHGSSYQHEVDCGDENACAVVVAGLAPGQWVHRIAVATGDSAGQAQARQSLVMARNAGVHALDWRLFRSVFTVISMDDGTGCDGCLRRALELAADAPKPMLIQFADDAVGAVVLVDVLPELTSTAVTIDGIDRNGVAHRRTIDANGLARAALRIRGGGHHIIGMRFANAGGDADVLLIEGPASNDNRIESVQIAGRATEYCERRGEAGCVLDRRCAIPNRNAPQGSCGDDGIAVRDSAGALGENLLVDVDVSGAFDKGIKVSEGGVARIERSRVHGNVDGGIQATLGGSLTAVENFAESNGGTTTANGIAANGPRIGGGDPAHLTTRGNIIRRNELRGLSVRSLSVATLNDDYVCGNGAADRGTGFGLAVLDAAEWSSTARVRGAAFVHNNGGGVVTDGGSTVDLGDMSSPGLNAFAFNGVTTPAPSEVRNRSLQMVPAIGNHWHACGPGYDCNEDAVGSAAVDAPIAAVEVAPARPSALRDPPAIHEMRPTTARKGDLVWIYGRDFDAIGAAAQQPGCAGPGRVCRASDPNCVFIGRDAAEILAATSTLLVIRAPFTCVAPVVLTARTRRSRGFARTTFCTLETPQPVAKGRVPRDARRR